MGSYNSKMFAKVFLDFDDWVEQLNAVTKEDIMRVSSLIRLQAVYFLEGES